MWNEYLFPVSVKEALEMLNAHKGDARIIAGGTDLVVQLQEGIKSTKCLVDITRLKELKIIEMQGDTVRIGAAVTHAEIASSPIIRKLAMVLAEAAISVGSPLIRNQGTLAGNMINAQPAADTAVALFSLNATVEIATSKGIKNIAIEKLYEGIGKSKINSTAEIATAIHFKVPKGTCGSSFQRIAQRKAMALPMLNTAVVVTIKNKIFNEVMITIAPVAHLPFRASKAENALRGSAINLDAITKAAELAANEVQPRDSLLRGSAEYRREMVKVLVRKGINQAVERAQN